MIAYLKDGGKKDPGCKAEAEWMKALLVNINVLISNELQRMT
jgi:hypothetical protein